jgi:hypothetical protein
MPNSSSKKREELHSLREENRNAANVVWTQIHAATCGKLDTA